MSYKRKSAQRRGLDETSAEQDYYDAIVDTECDHIEELLGLAFVVCQNYLTTVRTRISLIDRQCREEFTHQLSCAANKAYTSFRLGEHLRHDVPPPITIVNATANYWKHHDEWAVSEQPGNKRIRTTWQVTTNNQSTITIIQAIGMAYGSSGNLRTTAEALGVTSPYENLSPLRDALQAWAQLVLSSVEQELASLRASQITTVRPPDQTSS
ncbi:MAG: hypothetical protein JST93_32970 [Acidobacteria bacterium]|nr:hypothetical protein [Acidobacteriota bacterium]